MAKYIDENGLAHYTEKVKDALEEKQGTLTAGTNITIDENNVISATGGGVAYTAGTGLDLSNNEFSIAQQGNTVLNITTYGTPTINGTEVSGFSSTDYITPNVEFNANNSSWEIVMKVKDVSTGDILGDAYDGNGIRVGVVSITGGAGLFLLLGNGYWFNTTECVSTNTINTSGVLYIKVVRNDSNNTYYLYSSTTGTDDSWRQDVSYTYYSNLIGDKAIMIGTNQGNEVLTGGKVDLAGCYIKVNNITTWSGATLAGNVAKATTQLYGLVKPDGTTVTVNDGVISATGESYTAGQNIQISDQNVISATDTTYTAGQNIQISDQNVISATDITYTAGQNIQISDQNVISATDTTYTAGTNITIENNVISATGGGAAYTAGTGLALDNNEFDIVQSDPTYNFVEIGTLTKSNGVLSSFSTSNYARLPEKFLPVSAAWELQLKFTTSASDIQSDSCIMTPLLNGTDSINIWQTSGLVSIQVWESSSSSGQIFEHTFNVVTNTTYWMKIVFTGTAYTTSYSTNGTDFTTVSTTTSSYTVNQPDAYLCLGIARGINRPFGGSIDLNGCYLKVSGNDWWKGYTGNGTVAKATNSLYGLVKPDGTTVTINDGVISSTGKVYTAGQNIQISNQDVISATDTTYTAGTGLTLSNGQFSLDTSSTAAKATTTDFGLVKPDGSTIVIVDGIITSVGGGGGGSLPPQTGHAGEFLTTNGTTASWANTTATIRKWEPEDEFTYEGVTYKLKDYIQNIVYNGQTYPQNWIVYNSRTWNLAKDRVIIEFSWGSGDTYVWGTGYNHYMFGHSSADLYTTWGSSSTVHQNMQMQNPFAVNNSATYVYGTKQVDTKYKIEWNRGKLYINDTLVNRVNPYNDAIVTGLGIFQQGDMSASSGYWQYYSAIGKFYSMKHYREDVLIHHDVPVLNMSTGYAGLFDKITNTFQTGTGNNTTYPFLCN